MVEQKEICNKYYTKDIKLNNAANNNHLFISTNTDLGKTLERLSFNLAALYQEHINNGNFSWDNSEKKWKQFSEDEIALIQTIQ